MTCRIAVVTNIVPRYRVDFYQRLIADDELDCEIFCQPCIAGTDLKTEQAALGTAVTIVRAVGLPNEKITWQFLPLRRLADSFDMVFVYGNPRVVSNVLLSFWLRLRGVAVVIWGQAHTAGAGSLSESIRLWWWRRFSNIFLYADEEVRYLRARGFERHNLIGMNNGLNQDAIENAIAAWPADKLAQWRDANGLSGRRVLLSCARLVSKNSFDTAIEAVKILRADYPDILWCVIGSGPERQRLVELAQAAGISENICWAGAVFDEESLAPWFLSCEVLVHPGAIGLSLLHAFGYGVPVVTHGDAGLQMPEFAAFKDSGTGLAFRHGDAVDLAEKSKRLLDDAGLRQECSAAARNVATTTNNTAVMAARFRQMVNHVSNERRASQHG